METWRTGLRNLFWRPADGTGAEESLTRKAGVLQTPGSWSEDGRVLVFAEGGLDTGSDIWAVEPQSGREPRPVLVTPDYELAPRLSPDGRWLAYRSNASRRDEVYVQPFPGSGPRHSISIAGGTEPVWSPGWSSRGGELYYLEGDTMMAVPIVTTPSFSAGAPRALFSGRFNLSPTASSAYAVSPIDGRFLRIQPVHEERPLRDIQVVLNWGEELKQRVGR